MNWTLLLFFFSSSLLLRLPLVYYQDSYELSFSLDSRLLFHRRRSHHHITVVVEEGFFFRCRWTDDGE